MHSRDHKTIPGVAFSRLKEQARKLQSERLVLAFLLSKENGIWKALWENEGDRRHESQSHREAGHVRSESLILKTKKEQAFQTLLSEREDQKY